MKQYEIRPDIPYAGEFINEFDFKTKSENSIIVVPRENYDELKKQLNLAIETLVFYADLNTYKDTWKEAGKESKHFKYFYLFRNHTNDFENMDNNGNYHFYAGKRAIECLKRLRRYE